MSRQGKLKAKVRLLKREGIMRSIALKHFDFTRDDGTGQPAVETFDYALYLENAILNAPQRDGLTYSDLKHCLALDNALKARENGVLLLEEDTWKFVVNRLKGIVWTRFTPHTLAFIDDVAGAPQVEVKPKEAPGAE